MVIFGASEGLMFVKKVLQCFAISIVSVMFAHLTLTNSGNCVLFVVLFVTSLRQR